MKLTGRCHCGNISFLFEIEPDPLEIPARICTCSFCVKHGGIWTSSTTGSLRIRVRDEAQVSRYEFATRTAKFHVCAQCGVVPFVTSEVEGRTYAVVSVNALENAPAHLMRRGSASFDGEGKGERLARRARNWIPHVEYLREIT
jgi:hypothetical protein